MDERRLYVGGLSEEVLEKDIKKKFSEFGLVQDVELRCKENYGNRKYFAYINIKASKQNIDECIQRCNNENWKGAVMKVQPAKASYLQTIQKDIQEKKSRASEVTETVDNVRSSDEEPQSYLGVPAWTGLKSKPQNSHGSLPTSKKRLYIGGIPESVLESDIKQKFEVYGGVKTVEIKCKENFGGKRYFAYIDLETDASRVEECIRECNSHPWRGAQLKVELAKESFLQKAHNELLDQKADETKTSSREAVKRESQIMKEVTGEDMDCTAHTSRENPRQQHYEHAELGGSSSGARRKTWDDPPDSYSQQNRKRARHRDDQNQFHREKGDFTTHRRSTNAFESERNGLFDEIDAADELGFEQDELLSDSDGPKLPSPEHPSDVISEQSLKRIFDQATAGQGFVLSSLFSDQLSVQDVPPAQSEPAAQPDHEVERFEEEYWKRAEKVTQRSWEEMVQRNERTAHKFKMPSSFFFLPGDARLQEGPEAFRTDKDPAQFVECWKAQAEDLTLRLLQRKRNPRTRYRMLARAAERNLQKNSTLNAARGGAV